MKLFSKASEYAIRSMLRVAETGSFDGFSPKQICAAAAVPEAFGRKALAAMVKAKIIRGTRGPGGGYAFLRDPRDVSLLDIVLAVDGPEAFAECPLGLLCKSRNCNKCHASNPDCGLGHVCPLHNLWRKTRRRVMKYLKSTTLADVRFRGRASAK